MTTEALRDLNSLPGSERRNESSTKASLPKFTDSTDENLDKLQRKSSPPLASAPIKEEEIGNTVVAEVEYIESEQLTDLENMDKCGLLAGLESKDWVVVCESLNNVRRLSIFHKEAMLDTLVNVISLVEKSLKNPRSAVCKTAIMTSEDIFKAYGDHIIDSIDPLIVQLLLKSSQDKRFVCEAAEKALVAMTTWISPTLLVPKMLPHLKHRNPRIRAKASMCFCRSVPRLGTEGIIAYGIDKLIQIAAAQLTDQLPESREAARTLLLELRVVYEKSPLLSTATAEPKAEATAEPKAEATAEESEQQPEMVTWESYCLSKLSRLNAQAVTRVTQSIVTKQGVSVDS
ncbi:uncharacterized protein LOC113276425 isoform X2 [Papaver somniferum]|uniref:uncharacterized protein LOC113276425 isoform X2 n=1 Tax=Papaver somniferum TaxID=3469 RepID=UPI000E6F5508|nr:uncharacterized protein LOC113276425 isoform X2 [Papaver somniferum]